MMVRLAAILSVLALQSGALAAEPVDRVGDVYEIRQKSVTKEEKVGPLGSSGGSESNGLLTERVVAVGPDGVELEFDVPKQPNGPPPEWQFPARVLRSADGGLALLNRSELESRNRQWLTQAGVKPEACGQWYFTWTSFKVECDTQSAIDIISAFNLRLPLAEGAAHREARGLGTAPLRREKARGRVVLVAELPVDPEIIRRERSEMDAVVAKIAGAAPGMMDMVRPRTEERISGTIVSRFEIDDAGRVVQRVRVTTLKIVTPDGTERSTTTETTDRKQIAVGP